MLFRSEIVGELRGVAAGHEGAEIADRRHHALHRLAGHVRRGGRLAPADKPAVGLDADEHDFGGGDLESRARKSGVWGKSVSVRVDLGGRRILKEKQYYTRMAAIT